MKKLICFVSLFFMIFAAGCKAQTPGSKPSSSNTTISSQPSPSSEMVSSSTPPSISSSPNSVLTPVVPEADRRQIINQVKEELIDKYPQINMTNEWISEKDEYRYVVLFGSLKSDPRQGVAQVIRYNPECTQVLEESTDLDPQKHGAVKVVDLGARDKDMLIVDADGNRRVFASNEGFDPKE